MTEYRKHGSKASSEEVRNFIFKNIDLEGKKVLNLGCGNDYVNENGWTNLDGDKSIKADIYCDLEWDIPDEWDNEPIYDIIYASHILEHIHNLVELKYILGSVLKPNGLMIVIVPDYLSPDAWGDDTHCRAFSKESFLLDFWPGFKDGRIHELKVNKEMGECKWLVAYMTKGE